MNADGRRGHAPPFDLLHSQLDVTNFPAFRDRIRAREMEPVAHVSRTYAGFPRVELPKPRCRFQVSLDRVLRERRAQRRLGVELPTPKQLGRLVHFAHGVTASEGRGPTPSSGKLSALELYVAPLVGGWLAAGAYHYDRVEHCLRRVGDAGLRDTWLPIVPSLDQVEGGALLWIAVGDHQRVAEKYGHRAGRLLLLEAGHLMQNLCLLACSVGRSTVPLGGFFEREVACLLCPALYDEVLYVGVFG